MLEKDTAAIDYDDTRFPTQTVSVLLENNDRVFGMEPGTLVRYAISDTESKFVSIVEEIELFISSYNSHARLMLLERSSISDDL